MAIRPKISLRLVLLLLTVCCVLLAYLEMRKKTVQYRFQQMISAEREYSGACSWEDIDGGTLENGIPSLLKAHLEILPPPVPQELVEYLSTSVPSRDYVSYQWTFLSAKSIDNATSQIASLEHGYFPIAVADSNYAAVSLKDGRIYSAYAFDGHIEPEAESIKHFIDLSAADFLRHID